MSKHLDWSRITPNVAVWCKTEEEDLAFRQECEKRGILWADGRLPTTLTYFREKGGNMYNVEDGDMTCAPSSGTVISYSDLLVEDKPAKCRMAEVLGVEVGEQFKVVDKACGYDSTWIEIDENEVARSTETGRETAAIAILTLHAISHPESIIRKPRFTPDELATMSALHAGGADSVYRSESGALCWKDGNGYSSFLPISMFLSIRPDQSVTLAEVLK